jgi:hypothetical protein
LTLPAATDTLVGKATTDTLTNKTLTGAVMNGTLGATTPSTVAATTLTTSSTITHNGGTANGVAYLDGSKVLTTGSALVFDGSNLGVGVTPSAWGSGQIAMDIGLGSAIWNPGTVSQTQVLNNSYFNGTNFIYKGTAAASRYRMTGAQHEWYTAASGTAGNAITFTQAMTLDASGRLGIGTTSPQEKLQLEGSGAQYMRVKTTTTNADIYFGITSSSVGYVGTGGSDPLAFYTGGTERARIDSSGNLLVGKTATGIGNVGAENLANGAVFSTLVGSTGATSSYNLYSTGAGAYRFYVGMDGTINATSIVITAISDQRLKENIRDIDTGLSAIMALKPRRFDWKEGKGQDKKNAAGFIAQEFETVFPECVSTSKAGEDGIEYKNINHETLIPTLVKAIQEQQALITTLTARITALESA